MVEWPKFPTILLDSAPQGCGKTLLAQDDGGIWGRALATMGRRHHPEPKRLWGAE